MDIVADFYRAFQDHFSPLTIVWTEQLPASMLRAGRDLEGYVVWELEPRGAAVDFSPLDQKCGTPLPELFKEWLGAYCALEDFDCGLVRLVHAPPDDPLRRIQELFEAEGDVVKRGLLPFGYEATLEAGPICIDLNQGEVCFVDRSLKQEVQMFSSFEAMLKCITLALDDLSASADDFARLDPGMSVDGKRYWSAALS
ncbi:MAG TPA: hypothetical protein ENK10_06295 [Acidobacteria bacterium]|nr:hypothetical protein [Acidobacteriota bacterium]